VGSAVRFWLALAGAIFGIVVGIVGLKHDHDRPIKAAHGLAAFVRPDADASCRGDTCTVRADAPLRTADDGFRVSLPVVRAFNDDARFERWDTVAVQLSDSGKRFTLECRRADFGRAEVSVPTLREFCRFSIA